MSKKRGHFFSLLNEIFELGLSSSAFLVYSYLQRCANGKTCQCYPSYETIGKAVGLSRNTVQKCVGELADKGLIYTENTSVITKDGMKRNGNLRYTMLPTEEVVEAHHQRKLHRLELETALAKGRRAVAVQSSQNGVPGETQRSGFVGGARCRWHLSSADRGEAETEEQRSERVPSLAAGQGVRSSLRRRTSIADRYTPDAFGALPRSPQPPKGEKGEAGRKGRGRSRPGSPTNTRSAGVLSCHNRGR